MSKQLRRYFGVWSAGGAGHYLYNPEGSQDFPGYDRCSQLTASHLDSSKKLLPGFTSPNQSSYHVDQVQGLWRHTIWDDGGVPLSVLACWDRTGDSRGGCNSQFWIWGTKDRDEAERLAKEAFPEQWARIEAAQPTKQGGDE